MDLHLEATDTQSAKDELAVFLLPIPVRLDPLDAEGRHGVYVAKYLQGWIPSHPNRGLWLDEGAEPVCPNCGSHNLVKKGIERPARVNAYQRYKCKDCGANSRGRTVVQKAGEGVLV